MIEAVRFDRTAIAAEELKPRGVHRNAKGDRVCVGTFGQRHRRIDRYLIGEWRERREDSRTAHHDSVSSVRDLVQRDVVAWRGRISERLVDGRLNDRVRERDVLASEELLIRDQIRRTVLVAVGRPFVRASGKPGIRDVHVIRGAAHQADRELRDALQRCVPPLQVSARPRNHMAHVDRLARFGIGHQADVARLVLQIEYLRQRLGRAGEGRMRDYVLDLVVPDPDVARLSEPCEKLFSRSCAHRRSPWRSAFAAALTTAPATDLCRDSLSF